MNKIKKNWAIIVLLISSIASIAALIAQYLFNILPCQMCLYQRYPYYFIILFSIIYIITKKIPLVLYYWINSFAFAIGLFFSIWHVGIEQKILKGPSGCSGFLKKTNSIDDLKNQILSQDIISCADTTWYMFGFSAATINAILMFLFLFFNTITIYKIINGQQKN